MGKRKNNITGLSRFLAEATKQDPSSQLVSDTSSISSSQPAGSKSAGNALLESEERADSEVIDIRPAKKPKLRTGLLGPGLDKYDATGLVPFYTDVSQVPQHLQKYFWQRERYFTKYDSGCLLDEEGWYSVTPERVADQIAERCRCDVILDAFCGVGGNAIAFARTCERVIALDVSPVRLALARHNAALYGVQDRIEFILADFLSFARALESLRLSEESAKRPKRRKIDVVFLSPPWGGPSYITGSPSKTPAVTSSEPSALAEPEDAAEDAHAEFSLSSIRPIHGRDLFKVARGITKNVAYFLPRNTNLEEISQLAAVEGEDGSAATHGADGSTSAEKVEVEEEWMGTKLKALTCYFGGLVAGQESMFDDE
ncbi:S-adenosyl-L-methionine-dependent methyltransferase [Pilatotrama ljubarskyi]|nr:S-adenosyl-L-methionine-dependent methyltransferase [Pilatotrama ljubarskyi]